MSVDERNSTKGEFVRGVSAARNTIGAEDGKYPVESGRYHLYIAFNCPWCHRVALARSILGLEDVISMDVCYPNRTEKDHPLGENRWQFLPEGSLRSNGRMVKFDTCTKDTGLTYDSLQYDKFIYYWSKERSFSIVSIAYNKVYPLLIAFMYEATASMNSVPLLIDKKTKTVVNNESSDIIRMFETVFLPLAKNKINLYPDDLKDEIDALNKWVYNSINNGAYKAGFSSSQDAHEKAFKLYFDALDHLNDILSKSKFLCGNKVTEADLRLFPTIFRHDPVYYLRFQLNEKYIRDYPHLWRWLQDFYSIPGVAAVSPVDQIKQGYFGRTGNKVIPVAPRDFVETLVKKPSFQLSKFILAWPSTFLFGIFTGLFFGFSATKFRFMKKFT